MWIMWDRRPATATRKSGTGSRGAGVRMATAPVAHPPRLPKRTNGGGRTSHCEDCKERPRSHTSMGIRTNQKGRSMEPSAVAARVERPAVPQDRQAAVVRSCVADDHAGAEDKEGLVNKGGNAHILIYSLGIRQIGLDTHPL